MNPFLKGVLVYGAAALIAYSLIYRLLGSVNNTEQVCFNQGGGIIFYASGFPPGRPRMMELTKNVYKDTVTGKSLKADCRYHWTAKAPKGVAHWEAR